ncbi:MAG TPA: cyclase family protein [Candidatus Eisenbacteria bacterium]|nr:cyclase family protein [Candidatus Eisenbacteria bacterium]
MGSRWLVAVLALVASGAAAVGGPPVDATATRAPELVDVVALDPTIRLDVRYATDDNVAHRRLYPAARALLQRPVAEALVRVHRALGADGFGIVVFDAYRPWSVTQALWDATPADKREFVADPARGSRHNRGAAVDVALFDRASGAMVAMPSGYDEMTERAYPTFKGGDADARAHRETLRAAMEREGFFVHPSEWWHFDYKDWRDYPILDVGFDVGPLAPSPASFDLAHARVVDLTWTFDDRTPYWPTAPSGFELKQLAHGKTAAGYFYAANAFCAPEHGGTHMDAPIHFADGKWTVDQIPAERLVGPAVVIDVQAAAARDADYRLTVDDVAAWERLHGRIAAGTIVLLRTGWGARWPDRKRYYGDDTPGATTALHFPSFGAEAAALLVRDRRVTAIGVDTASIDHGPSQDFPVHQIVGAADVPGLENVAHLDEVPETGAWVVALPMKIGGGSGGPLRIVALVSP